MVSVSPNCGKGASGVGDTGAGATPSIACKKCRVAIPVQIAVIRMGGAQLFVFPHCNHQEVWRPATSAEPAPR